MHQLAETIVLEEWGSQKDWVIWANVSHCASKMLQYYIYIDILYLVHGVSFMSKPVNFASSLCFSCNVGFQFPEFLAFSHWVLLPLRFALIGTSRKALEAIAAVVTLDRGDGQAHTHTRTNLDTPRATKTKKMQEGLRSLLYCWFCWWGVSWYNRVKFSVLGFMSLQNRLNCALLGWPKWTLCDSGHGGDALRNLGATLRFLDAVYTATPWILEEFKHVSWAP